MKTKIFEFITAFLIGAGFVFSIFFISGKHQEVKESDRVDIDTFKIISKLVNAEDSLKYIYSSQNQAGWINYINTNQEFVTGYDEVYYSVKK